MSFELNKEQKQAVYHDKGPLLIIAGAGTGKTTVVTERIKYLISEGMAKPSEILAMTFTEKSAKEMEERVDIAMPYGYTQMWISTFHSFCDRLLRQEALAIGLDTSYKLMTTAETIKFVTDNLYEFNLKYFRPIGNPTKFIHGMLQHFSRLQDENISPIDYTKWVQDQESKIKNQKKEKERKLEIEKWEELANAYKKYEELKIKEGRMDFGDLISKTLDLFRERPNVLKEYKMKFKYVLIDEFQDTNIAQYEMVKLLVPPGKNGNLTVVGDDSQSIYKFRGAAVSNILQFKKDYKKAKSVVLIKNYRSTQAILDPAYRLIRHNNPDTLESKLGIDKNLVSVSEMTGKAVRFVHVNRVENEAEEVAKEIERLANEGYKYKDMAILVRANNHADPFVQTFQSLGVPHQFLGPAKLLQQAEIIELIAYLKVLYDFDDSISLLTVLSIDHFEILNKDLIRLANLSRKKNQSLYEICSNLESIEISNQSKQKISSVIKILEEHLEESKREPAGRLVYKFLEETGLMQSYINPDTKDVQLKVENIALFFDKIKGYESGHAESRVPDVVDWIDLLSREGEAPAASNIDWSEADTVNILTVHSAKGLEFPVVFLVNLVSHRFPTINRREQIPIPDELIKEELPEGDYHIQEERRLFYVGMTRAEERLYFTAANYYAEAKREKRLSPFIFEALGDEAVSGEQSMSDNEQLSILDYGTKDKNGHQVPITDHQSRFHIDYLSYSQIRTYEVCPVHYKLSYILRIPTVPTAALSFGTAMHATMNDFYLFVRKGEKPTKKLLYDLLDKNWINEGFRHKKQEKEYKEKGEEYLSGYLKKTFGKDSPPVALERSFLVTLKKDRERPLKIGGTIDRVDMLKGQKIEIVDYKTSENVPSQKDVDANEQLTFYALAATKMSDKPFAVDADKIYLSLYYFEDQIKITTTRTQRQLKEFEKRLFEIRKEIEDSDFRCSKGYICENCEFRSFCKSDN